MQARREDGDLWESWMLVREIHGERVQSDQVLLERLQGGRWQIHKIDLPGRGGPRQTFVYPSEAEAREALDDLYAKGEAVGVWHVSRFGHERYQKPTTDSKPHW